MMEIYESSDGKVRFYISHSDRIFSTGVLTMEPKTELPKHKRPVEEQLIQVDGICLMKLYEGENIREVTLREGDLLKIPPNQYHTHSNPANENSITIWRAEGDITQIIEEIKRTFRKV